MLSVDLFELVIAGVTFQPVTASLLVRLLRDRYTKSSARATYLQWKCVVVDTNECLLATFGDYNDVE